MVYVTTTQHINDCACVPIKLYPQNRQWAGYGPQTVVADPRFVQSWLKHRLLGSPSPKVSDSPGLGRGPKHLNVKPLGDADVAGWRPCFEKFCSRTVPSA